MKMLNKGKINMKKERRQLFKPNSLINKDNEVTTKIYKINKILDTSKYKF